MQFSQKVRRTLVFSYWTKTVHVNVFNFQDLSGPSDMSGFSFKNWVLSLFLLYDSLTLYKKLEKIQSHFWDFALRGRTEPDSHIAQVSKIIVIITISNITSWFLFGLNITQNEKALWLIRKKYSRMDQVEFVESLKTLSDMVSRPHLYKCFKGCLPQNSLGPFLNTSSRLMPQT